jgi:hypothetical protein
MPRQSACLGGGRVDRDRAPGVVHEMRELAAPDEMRARADPGPPGEPVDGGAERRAPVLERMGLEDEVVMRRRALGEGRDHDLHEFRHRGEGRALPEGRVMLELEEREVVGRRPTAGAGASRAGDGRRGWGA